MRWFFDRYHICGLQRVYPLDVWKYELHEVGDTQWLFPFHPYGGKHLFFNRIRPVDELGEEGTGLQKRVSSADLRVWFTCEYCRFTHPTKLQYFRSGKVDDNFFP